MRIETTFTFSSCDFLNLTVEEVSYLFVTLNHKLIMSMTRNG